MTFVWFVVDQRPDKKTLANTLKVNIIRVFK